MSIAFDEAAGFALALPGSELSTSYRRLAVKVRGNAFLFAGRDPGAFAPSATLDEIDLLKEGDPAAFRQTPHYQGWGAVPVRDAEADAERLRAPIERAWSVRASKAQRALREQEES